MRPSKLQYFGPRTISHALHEAGEKASLTDVGPASIHVGQFRLPAGDCVFMTRLYVPLIEANIWLQTSKRFQAIGPAGVIFDSTDKLDGAQVKGDGSVHLTDGRVIRAVDIIPYPLPYELSDLDLMILRATISLMRAWPLSVKSLGEGISNRLRRGVPKKVVIDYARLARLGDPAFRNAHNIRMPYIKEIAEAVQSNHKRKVSGQAIANALAKVGISLPTPNPSPL